MYSIGTVVPLFVPRPDSMAAHHIDPGSGIVGRDVGGNVIVYFEGGRYWQETSYAKKCHHAWGRMRTRYPTAAMGLYPARDLYELGSYNSDTGEVLIASDHARQRLIEWIGRALDVTAGDMANDLVFMEVALKRSKHA